MAAVGTRSFCKSSFHAKRSVSICSRKTLICCSLIIFKRNLTKRTELFHLISSAMIIITRSCIRVSGTSITISSRRCPMWFTSSNVTKMLLQLVSTPRCCTQYSISFRRGSVRLATIKYVDLLLLSVWFAFKAVSKLRRSEKNANNKCTVTIIKFARVLYVYKHMRVRSASVRANAVRAVWPLHDGIFGIQRKQRQTHRIVQFYEIATRRNDHHKKKRNANSTSQCDT